MERNRRVNLANLSSEEFLKLVEDATPEELMELGGHANLPASTKPTNLVVAQVLNVSERERGLWEIIRWWEVRRPLYNLAVGLIGLPALLWMLVHDRSTFWLLPAFLYGLAANACYTAGWISEYLAKRWFGQNAVRYGSINFAMGTIFSVLLTLVLGFLFITALIRISH